jgi:hypothetical protein
MYAAAAVLASMLLAARPGAPKPIHPGALMIWHYDPPEPALGAAGYWYNNLIGSDVRIDGSNGFVSSPNALVLTADYWPGNWGDAGAGVRHPATPGLPVVFSTRVKADATTQAIGLILRVWDGDPVGGGVGALLQEYTLSKSDIGSGWQTWTPGSATPSVAEIIVELTARDPSQTFKTTGAWAVDDFAVLTTEDIAMAKRREIREALVTRLLTITTGNGYAQTVSDVSTGPVRIPDGVTSFPHVTLLHGEEVKTVHTLGRTRGVVTFYAGVVCRQSATARADDQCDDLCADIEKAVRTFASGQFLALGYIENVFVGGIDPMELSPEIARDIAAWTVPIEVTYTYLNGQP